MKKNLIFSVPDTPWEKLLSCLFSTVHKQAALGLLFCFSALPLFTALSSWTALFFVCKKLYNGEEVKTFSAFFSAFRQNFKKTALFSLLFTLLFSAGIYSAKTYFSFGTALSMVGGAVSVSFLILFALLFLFFPQYLYTGKKCSFLESFVLSLPRCALCLGAVGLVCGVLIFLLPFSAPLLFTLAFPLSCLFCVFIFEKKPGKADKNRKQDEQDGL